MRTPTLRFTVRSALVVIAIFALITATVRDDEPGPPDLAPGMRLKVATNGHYITAVAYDWSRPPPWPAGNCFRLAPVPRPRRAGQKEVPTHHVANMHWENFQQIVKRLGLERVLVEYDGQDFLVVDPRIPRDWLREEPCGSCVSAPKRNALVTEHPDKFSKSLIED